VPKQFNKLNDYLVIVILPNKSIKLLKSPPGLKIVPPSLVKLETFAFFRLYSADAPGPYSTLPYTPSANENSRILARRIYSEGPLFKNAVRSISLHPNPDLSSLEIVDPNQFKSDC